MDRNNHVTREIKCACGRGWGPSTNFQNGDLWLGIHRSKCHLMNLADGVELNDSTSYLEPSLPVK